LTIYAFLKIPMFSESRRTEFVTRSKNNGNAFFRKPVGDPCEDLRYY